MPWGARTLARFPRERVPPYPPSPHFCTHRPSRGAACCVLLSGCASACRVHTTLGPGGPSAFIYPLGRSARPTCGRRRPLRTPYLRAGYGRFLGGVFDYVFSTSASIALGSFGSLATPCVAKSNDRCSSGILKCFVARMYISVISGVCAPSGSRRI